MSVQYVDPIAPQKPRELHHRRQIADTAPRFTTEADDPERFHVFAQPRRHRIERGKEHFEACPVMPTGKLRKEAAGVAVLSEVKNAHKEAVSGQRSVVSDEARLMADR